MALTIELNGTAEEKARALAARRNQDVADYVRILIENQIVPPEDRKRTPEEIEESLKKWNDYMEWVRSRPPHVGFVDDSRESMY